MSLLLYFEIVHFCSSLNPSLIILMCFMRPPCVCDRVHVCSGVCWHLPAGVGLWILFPVRTAYAQIQSDHCHTQSESDGSPSVSLLLLSLSLLSPGGRATSSPPRSIGVDSESYNYHKKTRFTLATQQKPSPYVCSQSRDRARTVTETHH